MWVEPTLSMSPASYYARCQSDGGRFSLVHPHSIGRMQDLSVEVADADRVLVDDVDLAYKEVQRVLSTLRWE